MIGASYNGYYAGPQPPTFFRPIVSMVKRRSPKPQFPVQIGVGLEKVGGGDSWYPCQIFCSVMESYIFDEPL